jgi:hypothetical protein
VYSCGLVRNLHTHTVQYTSDVYSTTLDNGSYTNKFQKLMLKETHLNYITFIFNFLFNSIL